MPGPQLTLPTENSAELRAAAEQAEFTAGEEQKILLGNGVLPLK